MTEFDEEIFRFINDFTGYARMSTILKLCKMTTFEKLANLNNKMITEMVSTFRKKLIKMEVFKRKLYVDTKFVGIPRRFVLPPVIRVLLIEGIMKIGRTKNEFKRFSKKFYDESNRNESLIIRFDKIHKKLCEDQMKKTKTKVGSNKVMNEEEISNKDKVILNELRVKLIDINHLNKEKVNIITLSNENDCEIPEEEISKSNRRGLNDGDNIINTGKILTKREPELSDIAESTNNELNGQYYQSSDVKILVKKEKKSSNDGISMLIKL